MDYPPDLTGHCVDWLSANDGNWLKKQAHLALGFYGQFCVPEKISLLGRIA